MEKLIINDLSIRRARENAEALNNQLVEIVKIVHTVEAAKGLIRCSRNIVNNTVLEEKPLIQYINENVARESRFQVLSWVTNHGPFWDDERAVIDFDSFNYESSDVTDQGLGELGRLHYLGVNALAYSFRGSEIEFNKSPLRVSHSLEELVVGSYDVENIWNIEDVTELLRKTEPPISSWKELLEIARKQLLNLEFNASPHDDLMPVPFSSGAARRIYSLLKTLDKIADGTNEDGSLNDTAQKIIELHFHGDRAAFSDESESNKKHFKRDLIFKDADGSDIFAPWHGKVNTPKLRVHYEWPRPLRQKKIKILYVGDKLTKK